MIKLLKQIADIQAGHPFRGGVPAIEEGNACALQLRDLSPQGEVDWDGMVRTQVDAARPDQWLVRGDVLFAARGTRLHAVCLGEVPTPTVCSPNFFLIRTRTAQLMPQFLAWQINRPPCQHYLACNAEGTDQLNIRRPVLEALPVALPCIARQQSIIRLAQVAFQEARLLRALIRNREMQLDALAYGLAAGHAPAP